MNEKLFIGILDICLLIESKAEGIYRTLAGQTEDARLRSFWNTMAVQESTHMEFWKDLGELARTGFIPPVIEDPRGEKEKLDEILARLEGLERQAAEKPGAVEALMITYRLEFHVLHPDLLTLLGCLKKNGRPDPLDLYEEHINGFIAVLREHRHLSTGLELIGETLEQLWRENRKLAMQSRMDFLTGLLNRAGMQRTMLPVAYLARRNRSPVGAMMIDIDDFKQVNECHGHPEGDKVLQSVARAIKGSVRKSDLVGRYGGEEFLVFMPQVEPKALPSMAWNLRHLISEETKASVPVTVSIGATHAVLGNDVEADILSLISKADDLLLQAKAAGKNRVFSS